MKEKEKWYESTKKTLGVVGFFLNFILQGFAIWKDPTLITILAPSNTALILGAAGLSPDGAAIPGAVGVAVIRTLRAAGVRGPGRLCHCHLRRHGACLFRLPGRPCWCGGLARCFAGRNERLLKGGNSKFRLLVVCPVLLNRELDLLRQ